MKKFFLLLMTLAFLFGLATQAGALAIGDEWYLGSINDGIPSNPANEVVYINDLTDLTAGQGDTVTGTETYNRVGSSLAGPFPEAVEAGSLKDESGGTTFDAAGFAYILGKYDASNAGSLVWYFESGALGEVVLPAEYNGYGLSHISVYNPGETPSNPVPEPATMLLFGSGLIGFVGLRRRFRKK